MDTKLTLSVDQEVIERAKLYAKSQGTSLSALVENFLRKLTAPKEYEAIDKTSIVAEFSGILELPKDYDYRKDLAEKMGKKHR